MFIEGQVYKRKDIHDLYGGNRQSGICPSKKSNMIFLFTGKSGEEHGYKDGWGVDGFFAYTGEGQVGDMEFKRGNLAIKDHLKNEKTLHLFEKTSKGLVKYLGEMCYHNHTIIDGYDNYKHKRKMIVFNLTKK